MKKQIRVIRKRIKRTPYILVSVYVLFVLMSMFVVASYTWFTMSRVPRVSDMNIYITTDSSLVLSADPYLPKEQWELQMDFWKTVDIPDDQKPLSVTSHVPIVMRPVTWSENEQQFRAAAYGSDGRLKYEDVWEPLTDEHNANQVKGSLYEGYYMKSVFYARCDMATEIVFAPAMVVDERGTKGSGTYVIGVPSWDEEGLMHMNSGKGAESAVRIGVRTTPMMLTNSGELMEIDARSEMFIYEPNADRHMDGTTGYIPTPSIDGTDTLVDEERLILQKSTTWADLDLAEIQNIKLSPGKFFQDPPASLFYIRPETIVKIELYLWLEGQDVDCTNAMNGAQLIANIQFTGDNSNQSGLSSIHRDDVDFDDDGIQDNIQEETGSNPENNE